LFILELPAGELSFLCEHCGKAFPLKWTLDLHLRTHFSDRPFPCDHGDCSSAFPSKKDLLRHKLIHSGEKPFKCWVCGTTAFGRRDHLKRHLRHTHNLGTEVAAQLTKEASADYLSSILKNEGSAATPRTLGEGAHEGLLCL